jgi:hypothetical protein
VARIGKTGAAAKKDAHASGNKQVRVEVEARAEIEAFLHALESYPEHFAADPQITFEEHCCRLICGGRTDARRS